MRMLKPIAAALAGTVMLSAAAQAADPAQSWPAPPQKVLMATEFASGWYIRGDLGYRFNSKVDRAESNVPFPVPLTGATYEDTAAIGGGYGYKWKWFRADLTVDYALRSDIQASSGAFSPLYSARIDAITILANAYLDLGTWAGFTPYVGIGGGTTRFNVSDFRDHSVPIVATESQTQKWGKSWAWMAGLSYQMTHNLLIDVGYRQLYLGDALAGPNALGREVDFRKLSAQEVRVGLRMMIDW